MIKTLLLFFVPFLTANAVSYGQAASDALRDFIIFNKHEATRQKKFEHEVKRFYESNNFRFAWVGNNDSSVRHLMEVVRNVERQGLKSADYPGALIESFCAGTIALQNLDDSVELDVRFTETALRLCYEMARGNEAPVLGYNGLKYTPNIAGIATILKKVMTVDSLQYLDRYCNPSLPELPLLLSTLHSFINQLKADGFQELTNMTATSKDFKLRLWEKLRQLGAIGEIGEFNEIQFKTALKKAQAQFDLLDDGIIRPGLMAAMNVPLQERVRQLQIMINHLRWLSGLANERSVIVVNIPSAYLKVYSNNNVILEMRMILGKKSTPTPTLASSIQDVVTYPYWHVPRSIVTNELFPLFKSNPAFVAAGNFQLLDKRGRIVDPQKITWKSFSANNFPYIVRQSTGCDNALGLLKLNFYSPYGVYLHDTPLKAAFMLGKRYLSHGCLRMENPMALAHLILKDHPLAIDSVEEKGNIKNQSPTVIPADDKMPVIVWYALVDVAADGRVVFYEDVYNKNKLPVR